MNELALFCGIGGGLLASRLLGHRIVCAVEVDPYRREIVLRRQEEGILPPFPIWDDVRTFAGEPWRGAVDIVSAGFPCQPFSVAGKQLGGDDDRNLWPETIRIIREVRPRYAFLENVPGILNHEYARTVFGDMAAAGLHIEWDSFWAWIAGVPQNRERLWFVASDNPESGGPSRNLLESRGKRQPSIPNRGLFGLDVYSMRRPEDFWRRDPPVFCRGNDGIPYRVERLGAIGDSQIPIVAATAFRVLHRRIEESALGAGK